MTVCIAALAEFGTILFMVSDSKISTGVSSGDHVAHKQYPLNRKWCAMIAGDDIAFVEPIIDNVIQRLIDRPESQLTVGSVSNEFTQAYQEVRRQHAVDRVLSTFGLSMDEFLKQGRTIFGSTFREIKNELDRTDLGCEFLVAGFDQNGVGNIFTVSNPGISRNRTSVGYWAIGSGAYTALSAMLFHSVNWQDSAASVMYHVLEAKFMAESADGVGKHTLLNISGADGPPTALTEAGIENIRKVWAQSGRPRVPPGVLEGIEKGLEQLPDIQSARKRCAEMIKLGKESTDPDSGT